MDQTDKEKKELNEAESKESTSTNLSEKPNEKVIKFINKKSEISKSIQDYLFKSFYNRKNDLVKDKYEFWDTQPVPKITTKEITVKSSI